ncbi:MAG TPA: 50S ribosomal protein L4 [Candidatus Dormibacteraeota bacterium]|nr:50S ribosomal protein L4 [Candidatus Dormibacteraeota bacterium]
MPESKPSGRTRTAGKPAASRSTATTRKVARPVAKKKDVERETSDPLHAPYFDALGERNGEVELPRAIFAEQPNVPVMHQAYVRQLANARQGTASTKTRATVSGGGAKPYRQKGTGRARHGSTREPSMKGGAVVFGPRPRSYAQKMPKQMRRLALRSALSQKAIDGQVRVIESFVFDEPKTRQARDLMAAIGFDGSTLIVLPAPNYVVSRSFDNLPDTKLILARNINIRDLFSHTYLLISKDSIELLEENFSHRDRQKNGATE